MKKRILSILLTAALACMVLAGCKKNVGTPEDNAVVETEEGAEEEEESGYLFGYSGIDMDNPYFETLELSIKTTLEEKGHRIMTKNPGADAALQNEQIRELIEADVDAVFLSPVDQGNHSSAGRTSGGGHPGSECGYQSESGRSGGCVCGIG